MIGLLYLASLQDVTPRQTQGTEAAWGEAFWSLFGKSLHSGTQLYPADGMTLLWSSECVFAPTYTGPRRRSSALAYILMTRGRVNMP